ncbi:GNAT family N-acetyltransferase [Cryptosporangium sp. NPDC051539]|uniref:GNAT family N-acetyltransferase n=1 Tax=Cryptosporangium sp. NPDC051539 TaxID=3363962 RepID=UPI0037A49C47
MHPGPFPSTRTVAHAALRGGAVVALRPARACDSAAVAELHRRATPGSLRDRYPGSPPPALTDPESCLGSVPGTCTIVAFTGFRLVGVAQVVGHSPVADVGVLVREDHRRRGLGAMLVRHALHVAYELGYREAVSFGGPENKALRAMLHRLGLEGRTRYTGDLLVTRVPLPYEPELPASEPEVGVRPVVHRAARI